MIKNKVLIRIYGFLIGLVGLPILFLVWFGIGLIFLLVPFLLFMNPWKYIDIKENSIGIKGLF